MFTMYYTRNKLFKQKATSVQAGFLCIELLQGLLILGVLLLLVSAFYVLSVHWQQQAIKRLEALDLLESQMSGVFDVQVSAMNKGITVKTDVKRIDVHELALICGKPVYVEQKTVSASWSDERGKKYSMRMIS